MCKISNVKKKLRNKKVNKKKVLKSVKSKQLN